MILRNAMKTPDGTIIESFYRHDYVSYEDANGETYVVDGGIDYLRRSSNKTLAEDLSIHSIDGDHEFNRKNFKWGTYGSQGTDPFHQIALMDMSTKHIRAVLETQHHIRKSTREFFEEELEYRAKNNK